MVKRIAVLHYTGPPIVGGVEVTIYHHARLLAARGYHVHIIAGRGETFHPQVTFHHVPEVDSRHPQVLDIGRALAQGDIPPAFYTLRDHIAHRLRSLLFSVEVTIVHNAMTLHKNMPLTAALRQLADEGISRFIAWSHDFAWLDELYTPHMHPGYPWDLLRTPWPGVKYVVVSEHRRKMLAHLFQLPEKEIAVVTPGVDVAEFLKLEPETRRLVEHLDLLNAEPLLMVPARLTRRKNIEMAIRVTAALRRHTPRPTLIVTGPPGPHNPTNIAYLNSLRDLRHKLDVDDSVHFLYECGEKGTPLHVTDAMMSDFYQLADVLLFPTRREGFGIPVLEAGLARLPIFAADIPPIQESAGNLAFRFDPDEDPETVAQAIATHLKQNAQYQMRKRVLHEFTWDRIIDKRVVPLILDVGVPVAETRD